MRLPVGWGVILGLRLFPDGRRSTSDDFIKHVLMSISNWLHPILSRLAHLSAA